jgi:glycosyltransferase involved in cell wall biosynthesis
MKISVVMASYLGQYNGCASNRVEKFKRAVDSFIYQTYSNCELIIVSDGCDITENIYNDIYFKYDNITFEKIEKDVLFGGETRNKGIELSSGDWICYLDSDDFLSKDHLQLISGQIIDDFDWYFSDDYLVTEYQDSDQFKCILRENLLQPDRIGTSSIIHKRDLNVFWGSGYAHDWRFIYELFQKTNRVNKIVARYNVCHIPNMMDL